MKIELSEQAAARLVEQALHPVPASNECAFEVGKAYLFRLATVYRTGRVVRVTPQEIVLADSAWIADTGRFSEAVKTGKLNEVEPSPGWVAISRGAIVDADEWTHPLPREVR